MKIKALVFIAVFMLLILATDSMLRAGEASRFREEGEFKIELSYKALWGDRYYDDEGRAVPYLDNIRIKRRLHMFHTEAFYGIRKRITVHGLFPIHYNTITADAYAFSPEELEEFNRMLNEYGIFNVAPFYDAGLGDVNLGALFALHRGERLTSFLDTTLYFPNAQYDQIDNLIDYPMSTGTYIFAGRLSTDYIINDELRLGAYLEYGYAFDRSHYWRLPEEGSQNGILTNLKGDVNINHGDYYILKVNFDYVFNRNFDMGFQPGYQWKKGDKVEGYEDVNFNYWLRQQDGGSWVGDIFFRFTGTNTVAEKFMDLKVGLTWSRSGRNVDQYQMFYATMGWFF